MSGQNPRQIAVRVLRQRRPGGEFTEALLDRALAGVLLSPADRALCQELVYGIVRWQATLDWLVARKTGGREQTAGLQNLLRLGLYQIFWLDRIPDHAAVHETVELAKQNGFGPKAGFVNAILRGYLREAEATGKILAALKISDPATGYSHPEWLVAKWRARFGEEKTRQLLEWNNTPPKTFARVNALALERRHPAGEFRSGNTPAGSQRSRDASELIESWREENVDYDFVRRDWLEENLVFELKSHPPLTSLASFRDGWFYIQDPSTLLAVTELDPQPGETVLDLCAAPGGKTTFIAQRIRNEGKIVACDISEGRLELVRENCARLGVTCVETILNPVSSAPHPDPLPVWRGEGGKFEAAPRHSFSPPKRGEGGRRLDEGIEWFDRILVDAPCSNTGVLRRRVDLRWRIKPEEIARLRQTQLDLLKLAASKLKPGGVLVYSTCSLEPEENSGAVQEFLSAHPDIKLASERELLPFADCVDGAYVAKLQLK